MSARRLLFQQVSRTRHAASTVSSSSSQARSINSTAALSTRPLKVQARQVAPQVRPPPVHSIPTLRHATTTCGFSTSAPNRLRLEPQEKEKTEAKVYDFDTVRKFSAEPDPDRVIIDVREPNEYAEGYIPSARNIPLNSGVLPEALELSAEDFEGRFGFRKPDPSKQEVIFYCQRGVRSTSAAKLAEAAGYEHIGNYKGSYAEWSEKGGEVAR